MNAGLNSHRADPLGNAPDMIACPECSEDMWPDSVCRFCGFDPSGETAPAPEASPADSPADYSYDPEDPF